MRFRRTILIGACAVASLGSTWAAATPPPPPPPPPPENRAFLQSPEPRLTSTGDPRVDAYRDRLLQDPAWAPFFVRLFAGVRADPRIVRDYDRGAALVEPSDLVREYVTPARVARGRALYRQMRGKSLPGTMPLEVRIALWGMLSDYGARPARYDAMQSLLVLAAYERGAAPWDFQLHHAARLLIDETVPRASLRTDATGRLGQPHILPDRFTDQARDGDGDGIANVWTNRSDILATITAGDWSQYPGMPIAVAVKPAQFDLTDPMDARRAIALEQRNNVPGNILQRWDGKAWTRAQHRWSGSYLEPYGKAGPAFLMLTPAWPVNSFNPYRLRYFNDDNDQGFALAAFLLSEAIAGRPIAGFPA